ncbi:MAG: flavodoxin family protein [Pseudomonadota bacterium]
MKVITLLGSSRKKGNTGTILHWVEDQIRTMGHEVESIHLESMDINGCLGCGKCKESQDIIGCVRNDDALSILDKMIRAQAVVFSSPLYFWGFSSQIKALIDRSYSLVVNYHQPGHFSLLEGQRLGLLITGGGPFENNAELVFTAFDRICRYYKAERAGELYIGPCTTPDKLDLSIKDKAMSFARKLLTAS